MVATTVDIKGALLAIKGMQGAIVMGAIQSGVGKAARATEHDMKDQLHQMIYSHPEPPGYTRTHRLFNGAHAAKPGTNHIADDITALGGDMAATSDAGVVVFSGGMFRSEVGDWVSYAYAVHEALGRGLRAVRPFSAQPAMNAEKHLRDEVSSALAVALLAL